MHAASGSHNTPATTARSKCLQGSADQAVARPGGALALTAAEGCHVAAGAALAGELPLAGAPQAGAAQVRAGAQGGGPVGVSYQLVAHAKTAMKRCQRRDHRAQDAFLCLVCVMPLCRQHR